MEQTPMRHHNDKSKNLLFFFRKATITLMIHMTKNKLHSSYERKDVCCHTNFRAFEQKRYLCLRSN